MPLRWEIPGGAVDLEDKSILHGAARELYEETGLVACSIVKHVGGLQEFFTRRGRKMGKVSFLMDVEVQGQRHGNGEIAVTLDPNEHVQFVWVSEEEARAKRVGDVILQYTTEAQEQTIYESFRIWKEQTSSTREGTP
jgi:8-oxo-dGTP pyrophosphatase MutT (NUDIX family)